MTKGHDPLSEKKRKTKAKPGNGGGGGKSAAAGGGGTAGEAGPMNVGFLQQLVDLMSANDLNTVDLRESGRRIILKRGAAQVVGGMAPMAHVTHAPHPTPMASGRPQTTGGGAADAADEDAGLIPIKSPMVGTFYVAASPDAKPFVSVGSQVVRDETDVCIIEAMKVFNNIKAEVTGTIQKIQVTNGQTVEFGTVLFLVKPS
jgi:acetyl-CoA carboxylase biotin carboxyl carrier protein